MTCQVLFGIAGQPGRWGPPSLWLILRADSMDPVTPATLRTAGPPAGGGAGRPWALRSCTRRRAGGCGARARSRSATWRFSRLPGRRQDL